MQLTISAEEKQGVTVLALDGRVVLGEECESLRGKIQELLAGKRAWSSISKMSPASTAPESVRSSNR